MSTKASVDLPGARPAGRRLGAVGGLFLLVLLAHGLLLAGLPLGVGGAMPGQQEAAPISVRRIVLPAAVAAPALAPAMLAPPALPQPQPPLAVTLSGPESRADRDAGRETVPPVDAAAQPSATASAAEASASASATGEALADAGSGAAAHAMADLTAGAGSTGQAAAMADAPPADAGRPQPTPSAGGELPVYATQLPAPATLHYDLRRGAIGGQGQLEWRPGASGYELSIEGWVFGIQVLSWRSRGGVDAAGLAPDRFVDSRRGRDVRAANFQRQANKISFSGTAIEYPLVPGAQDRLSWLVQLAAILEADPGRRRVGEKVSMFVAGARGDGDVWTFTVHGIETLELAGAALPGTVLLRREPRKAYDTQVEVWLDPARQHLPARLRLTTLPGGDSTEFNLRH